MLSAHRDVGHVRTPDLVRPIDGQVARHQLWPCSMLPMWFARLRPLVDRRQAHLAQSTDTMAPNAPALAA